MKTEGNRLDDECSGSGKQAGFMKKGVVWIIVFVAIAGFALWGSIVSRVEQASYKVVETHGDIEIREYAPMISAEAEVEGPREEAINAGFRILADYIFGNNSAQKKVAMTAPVTQAVSEKIAMTAPVTQQNTGKTWLVRFVMPSGYTIETIPKPNNNAVKLVEVPAKRFAAIRFSGMGRTESLQTHEEKLKAFLQDRSAVSIAFPVYAFYNPPWTLPFLRRNEVLVEIAR